MQIELTGLFLLFLQELREAILKTQKNAKIQVVEDTPYGNFLEFNQKILMHLHRLCGKLIVSTLLSVYQSQTKSLNKGR